MEMTPLTEKMIKTLVAVAWADGRVADEEREIIETLIDLNDLEEADARKIRAWAAQRRDLRELKFDGLEDVDKTMILQQAVFVTYVDGEQSDKELELLRDLAGRLGIEPDRAADIIRTATAHAKRRWDEAHKAPAGK
ncbi:MAG: TerB family tellurite resistance protein [Myxococcales bacterium]|nr:TerB family tellurite resistance protein [Myxococcales bacterium]